MAAAQASLRGRWLRQYGTERAFLHRGACRDRHSSSSGCSLAARSRVAWPHRPDGGSARTRFRSSSPPLRGPEREPKAAWPDLSRHPKALQCRCQAGTPNIRAKRGWTAASMPETRQKSAARAENSAGSRSQLRAPQQLRVDGDDDSAERHEDRAHRGGKHDAPRRENSGRERNRKDVVSGRPPEVLNDLSVGDLPNRSFGFEKCALLNTLNASNRNSTERFPPRAVRLNSEMSVLMNLGPRTCPIL